MKGRLGPRRGAAAVLGAAAVAILAAVATLAARQAQGPLPAGPDAITDCDRRAAHPSDPDKVGDGVATEVVMRDLEGAIAACERDAAAYPGSPRLKYQLGRVLYYAKLYSRGFGLIEEAARAGHRQAQFVAGLLYTTGQPGGTPDRNPCLALERWREAADRGHLAAQISLSRDVLRQAYTACPGVPDLDVVAGYLRSAARATRGYYETLLIEYLQEEIQRAKSAPR
jgi:hypothetical protein